MMDELELISKLCNGLFHPVGIIQIAANRMRKMVEGEKQGALVLPFFDFGRGGIHPFIHQKIEVQL
ncbi:hypothetical protein D3C74_459790 [compost metagenome]